MQLIIWKIRVTQTSIHLFVCRAACNFPPVVRCGKQHLWRLVCCSASFVLFVIACLFAFLEARDGTGTPPSLEIPSCSRLAAGKSSTLEKQIYSVTRCVCEMITSTVMPVFGGLLILPVSGQPTAAGAISHTSQVVLDT